MIMISPGAATLHQGVGFLGAQSPSHPEEGSGDGPVMHLVEDPRRIIESSVIGIYSVALCREGRQSERFPSKRTQGEDLYSRRALIERGK